MKKVTKFFVAALLAGMCSFGYAQTYEWQKPVKPTETKIETIYGSRDAGRIVEQKNVYRNGVYHRDWVFSYQQFWDYTTEEMYEFACNALNEKYKNNPIITIRNFSCNVRLDSDYSYNSSHDLRSQDRYYYYSCDVVVKDLSVYALEQALVDIRSGSRFAIDNITISEEMNKDDYNDRIVDFLLDRGYKVVAKDYLEKLYEEQQAQQSGIYNDKTTVKENNFSAIGYFINIKTSKDYARVQIVNVSTGEYDGFSAVYMPNQYHNNKVSDENFSQACQKALRNVSAGSRIAIDNVVITGENNKEYYKDRCINLLVKRGYKVVAKEYLEKLYEEQQAQQSGIFNERTTVQENNFSAVGYYINVKVTETSLRVQVVNVSTGEYEGNATVNF